MAGTERSGLTNAQIALCHRVCQIPANPAYSSLNVAQALRLRPGKCATRAVKSAGCAVTVAGRERATADASGSAASNDPGRRPASSEAVQALITHLEQALEAVQFLDPAHPKKLMPRMRHPVRPLCAHAGRVDMWRGVCTAMIATAGPGVSTPKVPHCISAPHPLRYHVTAMLKNLREDIACILERDPAARSKLEVLTCYPGLHAIMIHRAAHWLWAAGFLARPLCVASGTYADRHRNSPPVRKLASVSLSITVSAW